MIKHPDYNSRYIETPIGMKDSTRMRLLMREQYWYWHTLVAQDEANHTAKDNEDYVRRCEELEASQQVLDENGIDADEDE